jgi:uncharacterized protein YlxW (UPF0749 family)
MSKAEPITMEPRIREQALPEKDDDRFFDRWAVDKAGELGARAVKRVALDKLREAIRGFAEWRSLRHAPAAERESMEDRALVASTPERIEKARAEASQLAERAAEAERKAAESDRELEDADDRMSTFRPALRGSDWDFVLTLLANVVVFAVDLFVIHVALGRIPGNDWEYWLTSGTMGAGAVVVGDSLGWMTAAGSVRKDGTLRRPGGVTIGSVAGVMVLAVWFFVQLSKFREFGLDAFAEQEKVTLGEPTFFMTAQILFLIAAAIVCFAYVARRSGRELLREQGQLEDEREDLEEEAKTLRAQAEQARRTAAEAPALRRAAEERILARERIAAGDAAHDLKQGEYLESLIEPEYMKERADVESGVSGWRVDGGEEAFGASWTVRLGFAIVATLGAGALAFWVVGGVPAVVFTSLIVAVAFAVAFLGGGDSDEASESRRERPLQYVARLVASARKGSERATDIEELVPFPPPQPEFDTGRNGRENGAGNGKAKQRSRAELVNVVEKIRQALDG